MLEEYGVCNVWINAMSKSEWDSNPGLPEERQTLPLHHGGQKISYHMNIFIFH